jgi:hypothetical protein
VSKAPGVCLSIFMIKHHLTHLKALDSFLKWDLAVGLINSVTWVLILPIIHKLQGVHLTAAFISLVSMSENCAGLVIPFFKRVRLRYLYLAHMSFSAFYVVGVCVHSVNIGAFLVAEAVLSFCFCISSPLIEISRSTYAIKKYGVEVFEQFRYLEGIRTSLGRLLGGAVVVALTSFCSVDVAVSVFAGMAVFMLCVQFVYWFKFYRVML